MRLFEVEEKKVDDKYTLTTNRPQYVPKDSMPNIASLVDKSKYIELIRDINNSNVTDEEKEFLRIAASRHFVFNYARIADYYAHCSPEMQKLMEKSALVIVDIDDAIANGYVRLSKNITRIMEESGEHANER